MTKHSPLPWTKQHNGHYYEFWCERDNQIGDVCASKSIYHDGKLVPAEKCNEIAAANVDLIIHSVNLLPEALAALTNALNFIENTEGELGIKLSSGDAVRAVLVKAEQLPYVPEQH